MSAPPLVDRFDLNDLNVRVGFIQKSIKELLAQKVSRLEKVDLLFAYRQKLPRLMQSSFDILMLHRVCGVEPDGQELIPSADILGAMSGAEFLKTEGRLT